MKWGEVTWVYEATSAVDLMLMYTFCNFSPLFSPSVRSESLCGLDLQRSWSHLCLAFLPQVLATPYITFKDNVDTKPLWGWNMNLARATFLSAWVAFSAERGGAKTQNYRCSSPPSLPSRQGAFCTESQFPASTDLPSSLSCLSWLWPSRNALTGDWGRFRRLGRAEKQSMSYCSCCTGVVLPDSAQIPKTSLTRFAETTIGLLWGGWVQWISKVSVRCSLWGQILPFVTPAGPGTGATFSFMILYIVAWLYISLIESVFASFFSLLHVPLFLFTYLTSCLYLFEYFKHSQVQVSSTLLSLYVGAKFLICYIYW